MVEKRLPEGWEWKRLGELGKIESGGTPRRGKQEYWKGGSIPWVKISDISDKYILKTSEKITKEGLENSSAKMFSKGSLLISIFATLGDVGILNIDAACNQALASIQLNNNNVDRNYLYYLLKSLKKDFEKIGRGVAQNNINLTILKSTKIPLPPLETQRKIVAILEKADETKRLRMQADELTSQLLQSVFLEMFGDPVKNPKGWEMVKLGDFGDWTSGGTPSRTKPEYFQGNIPWFTAGELNDSYLLNSKERITEEALEVSAAKIFPKETMLIGMYDTAAFKMGLLLHPASSNQACAAFIPKKEELDSLFALHLFKAMKPVFLSKRRGVRQKNLSQTIIKNFEVPLPPFSLQTEFRQIVERVEKMRQNQKQTQQEIDNLFNTLMQKAFKGELTT